ncbi:hypothetical protein ACI797_17720 [Geodermatophilus sp. SYSU D00691]
MVAVFFGVLSTLVASASAFVGIFKDLGLIAGLGLVLGLVALAGAVILYRRRHLGASRRGLTLVGTAFVLAATLLGLSVVTPREGDSGTGGGGTSATGSSTSSSSSGTSASPTASPTASAINLSQPCNAPDPTDPVLPDVEICVVYWCKNPFLGADGLPVSGQSQVKIRPRIINNTSESIDISLHAPTTLRLLVRSRAIDQRWAPPPLTASAGDAPFVVEWEGQNYWAIPPNVPRDATPVAGGMWSGFATIWDGQTIEPGNSYYKPLRQNADGSPVQEGDLVFQVPTEADGSIDVLGFALVIDGVVRGVAKSSDWPEPVHGATF